MAGLRKGARSNLTASAVIEVRVVPRSSRIAIEQESPGTFKIRLTAPPLDGKANAQLLKILSEMLQLPSRQIILISGETGRHKRIRIEGMNSEQITEHLIKK